VSKVDPVLRTTLWSKVGTANSKAFTIIFGKDENELYVGGLLNDN
jgi:hypothetical protein